MDFFIPDNVLELINIIEENGFEAYLVGGCVRDSILGKVPHDYDIATSASPEQIKSCFADYNVIETGIKHGTLTVVSGGENIEITTYRVDGEYSDHRHPKQVVFSDKLFDDLSRRDFTINAMAYNPSKGLIDNFGGQRDLFKRRIVCVGEPAVRFNEDALRIMRALRFSAVMDFEIEYTTSIAVHDLKRLLTIISSERIAKELELLICGISAASVLTEYADVIAVVIPEIKPCIGFDQHSKFHVYDVWTHTATALGSVSDDRDVRLALLLHDIAKPQCFRQDEEGSGHFPGHEKAGADIAEQILKRLHFSTKTVEIVTELIRMHYITPINDKMVIKQLLGKIGEDTFFKLIEVMNGDNSAKHSLCFSRVNAVEEMYLTAQEIIRNNECYSVSMLDINGNDISSLGISGKNIGDTLSYLLHEVIDGNVLNENQLLIEYAKKYIQNPNNLI